MNATPFDTRTMARYAETAAYGGLIDALGGIATIVLAIIGLTAFDPQGMAGIATIVFGAALLVQGGTILSEYAHILLPSDNVYDPSSVHSEGLSALLLAGAAGIVLGVLALLGIASTQLTAVAVIAFASALLLSSSSVRHLYMLESQTVQAMPTRSVNELLAGQMATGSAGVQLLAGLATLVLGILAVAGYQPLLLTLAALLVLGVTVLLTGGTLSGMLMSFVRPRRAASPRGPSAI
jgi:hypothetical protein